MSPSKPRPRGVRAGQVGLIWRGPGARRTVPVMETPADIRRRWSYLRGLLIEQLARFEDGSYQIMSDSKDVSVEAIYQLRDAIRDFDDLIAASDARCPPEG